VTDDTLPTTVRVERELAAPPHTVYDAWLDDSILAGFICPDGVAEVTIDPRVGGAIRIVMFLPDAAA
jgi:uncharacterized protein YndB with AHSA1/START domain